MRKKITMLFAALLTCVGVMAEDVFSNDNLKEITPGNYFIYYTDSDGAKRYLQTTAANTFAIVTETENPASYSISIGGGTAYSKAYYIKMGTGNWCFSNPNPNNNHTLTTGTQGWNATAYISTVVFENGEGLCALRSTNAPVSTWDENYFITHTDNHQVTAQEGSEGGESLFVWTIEFDRSSLANAIEAAQTTYDGLTDKTFAEAIALNTAIATAQGVYDNSAATLDDVNAQITALTAAKEAAALYPFVESALKTIEAGNYFIYYTDAENTKHYLQTSGVNSVVTVTENPVSYEIAAGVVANGKYTKAYDLKMNDLYISNTPQNGTSIKTETGDASLWKSQVIFEKDGKAAIRLTNATAVDSWHGNYFINSGEEEGTTIASAPSLGDALFIWTIEADLAGMRDEMAALKDEATALKATLEAVQPVTTPVTDAITALTEAISYAEVNASSNDMEVLNIGISQLTAANSKANVATFEGGALAVLEESEYVVYYEDANSVKHYLVNNKATNRAVTYTTPALYTIKPGNVNDGYASYAYFFEMNESRLSNPTNDAAKEIQVMLPGQNYERVWESPVLYVNAAGKYAIRTTNCPAGSGWSSDHFIDVDEAGTAVSASAASLGETLYKWNIVKASTESVAFDMTIDEYRYMTLYLNYAVNVPEGVTAYAVSEVNEGELGLVSVGTVIPKNTPVIIEGDANKYSFTYADPVDAYTDTNMLKGTWYDCNVAPTSGYDAYVMALDTENDRIVMGKALLNANGGTTQFKNRANKAYLEIAQEQAAGAAMFRITRGEEGDDNTTGIENVEANEELVIYDLAGRRVEKMEKGIYIVNGKKVVVK